MQCSADSWKAHSTEFKAIAANYASVPLASKKMRDDERRIMEYQIENVSDAEEFVDACLQLDGFTAAFEAL